MVKIDVIAKVAIVWFILILASVAFFSRMWQVFHAPKPPRPKGGLLTAKNGFFYDSDGNLVGSYSEPRP